MGCACMRLRVWCYAVSQPVCACFFPVPGNRTQWTTVSAGRQRRFVTARFHQPRIWSLVAVYLCNRAERGEYQKTEGLEWAQIFQSVYDSCSLALKP